jgi:hypothetical protein
MTTLPSGTVTFLFTDVDGSTRMFEDALRVCETALGGFVQCGAKLERGRGLHQRGTLLQARDAAGDRDAARADLTLARDLFTEVGALRDRRLAEEGHATP